MSADEKSTAIDIPLSDDPWGRFAAQLEEMMLAGASARACYHWAVIEIGVPEERYRRIRALIVETWKKQATTQTDIEEYRSEIRQKLLHIHQRALSAGKLDTAISALERVIDLDGLSKAAEIDAGTSSLTIVGGITNDARTVLADLMEKMQDRVKGTTLIALREYNQNKETIAKVSRPIDAEVVELEDEDEDAE